MKKLLKSIRGAITFSIVMILVCGVCYPLVVTAFAQVLFPYQANGSIIEQDGKQIASAIIGQDVQDERLFHGRLSAVNYNTYSEEELLDGSYAGVSSGSSNYANSNPKLKERLITDIQAFQEQYPNTKVNEIPVDLLSESASGLDPDISLAAANMQIPYIAKASGLSETRLKEIVDAHTTKPLFGVFGEESVNFVLCNIDIAKEIDIK